MHVSPNHKIDGVEYIPSPNCEKRPKNTFPEIIVIHAISIPEGEYITQNIIDLFTNNLDTKSHFSFKSLDGIKVSAHLLITRNGNVLQFVPFDKKAWHAGVSSYRKRKNCNDFSIGIELEGCNYEDFNERQYNSLNKILAVLMEHYGIKKEDIVGHSYIAPDRKTDPGPRFDWNQIK